MPMDVLDCVHRPASGTVAVRIVLEVGLEDRFQHDLGGRLNHPIANGGNAERTLAFAIRFWDHHTPHRIGPIRLRDQFLAQACQPPFQAPLLDLHESYSVNARSTRIGAGRPVGVVQNVLATDLVVEHVEAESRLRLRLAIQLPLKVPDLIWCYRAHRQSPSPRYLRKRTRSQGPLLRRHYPASTLQRPCPTPAVAAARSDVEAATLARNGSPLTTTNHPSDVLCPLPRRIKRVRVSITSSLVLHSPNGRRVCIRIVTFEACSGFTRVTARQIAQPPKVTFVTRLQSRQSPNETARQLPDLSTIIWVEPSSTDDSRLQGALPILDSCSAANCIYPWMSGREGHSITSSAQRKQRCLSAEQAGEPGNTSSGFEAT